ncbi:MAG: hypothetical protein ACK4PR_10840, partial [Gammaproteobacteria bacterium]
NEMSEKLTRKNLQQRNVLLPEDEDDEGGSGESGAGSLTLPEIEYYNIFELIRSKHKGKVEPGRKFHQRSGVDNTKTAEFDNDNHPLAAMAYFSGIDNRDETPLPGESTDEEAQAKLEFKKRQDLQMRLGLSNSNTPTLKRG